MYNVERNEIHPSVSSSMVPSNVVFESQYGPQSQQIPPQPTSPPPSYCINGYDTMMNFWISEYKDRESNGSMRIKPPMTTTGPMLPCNFNPSIRVPPYRVPQMGICASANNVHQVSETCEDETSTCCTSSDNSSDNSCRHKSIKQSTSSSNTINKDTSCAYQKYRKRKKKHRRSKMKQRVHSPQLTLSSRYKRHKFGKKKNKKSKNNTIHDNNNKERRVYNIAGEEQDREINQDMFYHYGSVNNNNNNKFFANPYHQQQQQQQQQQQYGFAPPPWMDHTAMRGVLNQPRGLDINSSIPPHTGGNNVMYKSPQSTKNTVSSGRGKNKSTKKKSKRNTSKQRHTSTSRSDKDVVARATIPIAPMPNATRIPRIPTQPLSKNALVQSQYMHTPNHNDVEDEDTGGVGDDNVVLYPTLYNQQQRPRNNVLNNNTRGVNIRGPGRPTLQSIQWNQRDDSSGDDDNGLESYYQPAPQYPRSVNSLRPSTLHSRARLSKTANLQRNQGSTKRQNNIFKATGRRYGDDDDIEPSSSFDLDAFIDDLQHQQHQQPTQYTKSRQKTSNEMSSTTRRQQQQSNKSLSGPWSQLRNNGTIAHFDFPQSLEKRRQQKSIQSQNKALNHRNKKTSATTVATTKAPSQSSIQYTNNNSDQQQYDQMIIDTQPQNPIDLYEAHFGIPMYENKLEGPQEDLPKMEDYFGIMPPVPSYSTVSFAHSSPPQNMDHPPMISQTKPQSNRVSRNDPSQQQQSHTTLNVSRNHQRQKTQTTPYKSIHTQNLNTTIHKDRTQRRPDKDGKENTKDTKKKESSTHDTSQHSTSTQQRVSQSNITHKNTISKPQGENDTIYNAVNDGGGDDNNNKKQDDTLAEQIIAFIPHEMNWMLKESIDSTKALHTASVMDTGEHNYVLAEMPTSEGDDAETQKGMMIFGDFIWHAGCSGVFAFEIELTDVVNMHRKECLSAMIQSGGDTNQHKKDDKQTSQSTTVQGEGYLWLMIHITDYNRLNPPPPPSSSAGISNIDTETTISDNEDKKEQQKKPTSSKDSKAKDIEKSNAEIQRQIKTFYENDPIQQFIPSNDREWVFYAQFPQFKESNQALYFDQITQYNALYKDALFRVVYRVLY